MIDLMNIMYRHADAVEKLSKIKADTDKQLVEDLQKIKDLAAERDRQASKLADLKEATEVVVNMVDDDGVSNKSLVERLRDALKKITSFLSDTSKKYLAHVLGLVKSHWPGANLTPVGDGLAEGCSDKKLTEYIEEVKPIASKLVDMLEQSSEEEA